MDLSALERAARASENSLDGLGFWLFFFTALVVIGLIAEYRHEVVEFWEEIRRPAAMFPWQKFWAITGGVLVTTGVAGELIVGIESSREETGLRNTNHQIESFLNDKASANEREAEQLRKDAERLKTDNLKLKASIQPRTLDADARKDIGKELSKFASHFSGRKIKVMSYAADAEGVVFSLEVMDVITRAGIVVDPVIGRIEPVGLVDTGLNITGPSKDEDFIRALETSVHARLDTDICGEWNPKYSDLEILVAVKPIKGLPRYKSPTSTSPCSNVR